MPDSLMLTKDGLTRLKEELNNLKTKSRKEIIERIRSAKEFGDLSENAEYEDAKNQQSFTEGRIQELEAMISRAKIIPNRADKSKISIGDNVEIECDGEKSSYSIVGANESDPLGGKISADSPIARALMGRKVGENVEVAVPDGTMKCKVLKIS